MDSYNGVQKLKIVKTLTKAILLVITFDVIQAIMETIIEKKGIGTEESLISISLSSLIQNIVLLLIVYYFIKKNNLPKEKFVNFLIPKSGVFLLVLAIIVGFALRYLSNVLDTFFLQYLPTFQLDLFYAQIMKLTNSIYGIVILTITVGIATSIAEEVFFRGFCYNLIRLRKSFFVATFWNIIIFLIFHPIPAYFPSLIISNIVICIFYEYTKSLTFPILVHLTFNIIPLFLKL